MKLLKKKILDVGDNIQESLQTRYERILNTFLSATSNIVIFPPKKNPTSNATKLK